MKRLKSLLIGLFCLVATLPIVYTNNVYAETLNLGSIGGELSATHPSRPSTVPASGSWSTTVEIKSGIESLTFTLSGSASTKKYSIKGLGKNISGNSSDTIDVSNWRPGIYNIELSASGTKTYYDQGDTNFGAYADTAYLKITAFFNPHTHSYTPSVTTKATCTTAGKTTWKCSCGASYTTPIPATGHI